MRVLVTGQVGLPVKAFGTDITLDHFLLGVHRVQVHVEGGFLVEKFITRLAAELLGVDPGVGVELLEVGEAEAAVGLPAGVDDVFVGREVGEEAARRGKSFAA